MQDTEPGVPAIFKPAEIACSFISVNPVTRLNLVQDDRIYAVKLGHVSGACGHVIRLAVETK